jgi:hypothetical protein
MAAAEVVGEPPADRIELDAAADAPAVPELLGLLEGQHLGLQELQLQRHREAVLGAPGAQPHEALARDEHLAGDHGLQAVEVGQPVGIGLVGPGEPEPLDAVARLGVLDQRGGLDAVADEVGGEGRPMVSRARICSVPSVALPVSKVTASSARLGIIQRYLVFGQNLAQGEAVLDRRDRLGRVQPRTARDHRLSLQHGALIWSMAALMSQVRLFAEN